MDDLKIIVFRQNEVLKKLETALSNAINRIESIERLCYYVGKKGYSDNLSVTLPKETEYGLLENGSCKSEELTPEIGDFDLNAVNSAFKLIPADLLKIDCNNQPVNLIENSNDGNSNFIRNINKNDKFISIFNSKFYHSTLSENFYHQRLEELSENMLGNISTNITSKLSELRTKVKHENLGPEIFCENNENYFCASNNSGKFQNPCMWKNEFKFDDVQEYLPKETLNFISNKLNTFNMCYGSNKNAILSNCKGKSAKNIASSNQLYIFDEEDNSSMRLNDPLDLEVAENEFYYLKGHIKRGSAIRDHSTSSNLDNCRLFNCLYPTREIKDSYDNIHKLGIYSNNQLTRIENNGCSIKEIKYHKPFEKVVGYVQIPYNAFSSRSFESSDKDQIKDSKTFLKEVNYLNSHTINKKTGTSFKEDNIFSSNIDQYYRQFTYIKGNRPIFCQFLCFQQHPILILRPLFSN
ncbi:uncharacterized protein ELE39_000661 [Cryptosporidium sp. chipmunk genotype I]|uniref:uncharacterized protein n=1 Tax=Cryptosporidium sp. chipmunk genotype I TaxID=1280935 RepID=UPI00351A0CC6|nr:hypothetical protein ELE39_000661 [Cryptosporidium sp. chipmunk genotype I]